MKFIDLTGQKFGRWTVIDYVPRGRWLCQCSCGNQKIVVGSCLKAGKSTSCGCYRVERGRQHGAIINLHHGEGSNGKESAEYRTWANMLSRCENPNHRLYKNYGARGIKVCERWHSYENFLTDVGRRPRGVHGKRPMYSLDRTDNSGDYEPTNCRWADWKTQNRNTRKTRFVDIAGVRKALRDWLDLAQISRKTFYKRLCKGKTEQEALGL